MAGRSSQNAQARHRQPRAARRHPTLIPLLAGFAFLLAIDMAVDYFIDSKLGRILNSHLTQLADPQSWIP